MVRDVSLCVQWTPAASVATAAPSRGWSPSPPGYDRGLGFRNNILIYAAAAATAQNGNELHRLKQNDYIF